MNLAPAHWIWFPSGRTLPNTFILFRREIILPSKPRRATGWITADSRYCFTVNGQRIQWGPAPCDPRDQDVDPDRPVQRELDLLLVREAGNERDGLGARRRNEDACQEQHDDDDLARHDPLARVAGAPAARPDEPVRDRRCPRCLTPPPAARSRPRMDSLFCRDFARAKQPWPNCGVRHRICQVA